MQANHSQKASSWIVTPVKELAEPFKNIACKKMLDFQSEPPKRLNIESQSLSKHNITYSIFIHLSMLKIIVFYFRNFQTKFFSNFIYDWYRVCRY